MNTTPSRPSGPDQPVWGTASTPPAGSGSDFTGPTPAAGRPGRPGAQFFDGIRSWGLVRSDEDRRVAGVAAGIARHWNVHPTAVRIAFVVLTVMGGLGAALYGLGWMFLPHPDGRIHAQQVLSGTVTAGFLGALLLLVCSAPVHGPLLPLALVALLVWKLSNRTPHPAA